MQAQASAADTAADFSRALSIMAAQRNDALNALVQAQVGAARVQAELQAAQQELAEARQRIAELQAAPAGAADTAEA